MDFGLSDEQELLQETVRGFAARACPPARVRELFDSDDGWDAALWRGLAELGLTGLAVPERWGGAGLEILDLALVCEVLGEACVPGPLFAHALAALALVEGGSDAQRDQWLPRLASGEALATLALPFPDGSPALVAQADRADLLVVGAADGGLALVEGRAPGVRLEPFDGLDRTRRCLRLELERAAGEPLPGGQRAARRARDVALVLLAADAFGCAWQLIRSAVAYLGTREQFGTPLVQFQAIKHQLANLLADLEPARALWWYAAHAQDHVPEQAERAAALAKAHVTDRAVDTAREVVELHGGIGFTWDCDVHIGYKRALFDRAYLGAPALHRERSAQLAGWLAP
jgi:alkylation response protein AidB-like acyl-CoA dehydrogenase